MQVYISEEKTERNVVNIGLNDVIINYYHYYLQVSLNCQARKKKSEHIHVQYTILILVRPSVGREDALGVCVCMRVCVCVACLTL